MSSTPPTASQDWLSAEPRPVVSVDGVKLTAFGTVAFDDEGRGPWIEIVGCPNCGKRRGEWWYSVNLGAAMNSGRDPNEPCSRVCRLQWEYAGQLAARDGGA